MKTKERKEEEQGRAKWLFKISITVGSDKEKKMTRNKENLRLKPVAGLKWDFSLQLNSSTWALKRQLHSSAELIYKEILKSLKRRPSLLTRELCTYTSTTRDELQTLSVNKRIA